MKTKILKASKIALFTSLTFLASKQVSGQCTTPIFQDDFNTANLWTISDAVGCSAAGNGRILNAGGLNGNLSFTGIEAAGCSNSTTTGARNGSNLRAFRAISTLNNSSWTAEFKFRITNGNSLCHTLLAVTAGNQHPQGQYVTISDDGVTQTNFTQSSQDGIFASIIAYGLNQYPGSTTSRPFIQSVQNWDQTHMGSTTDPTDMGWRIYGHAKNGNGPFYVPDQDISPVAASNINNPTANYSRGISLKALNTDYYLRLERTSPTTSQISVFEDAAMTIHLVGSPQCFTIDPDITNLNTVQNSTHGSGVRTRTAEGNIDDLKIFDNCNPHNLIPTITCNTTFCQGAPITATGINNGNTSAVSHYWEIIESNSSGVPTAGATPIYQWLAGNPGTYQFPNNLACNKYYRIKLAFSNMTECLPWAETTKIVFVSCKPTPVITGNTNLCYGNSTMLCFDNDDYYQPSTTYTLTWGPKKNNLNCITTPTLGVSNIYSVTVTNTITGCVGQASVTVNVYDNNPDFSLGGDIAPGNPSTYTCHASPASQTATLNPNFGYSWIVEEVDPVNGDVIVNTTVINPWQCWISYGLGTNEFSGYNGTNTFTCGNPSVGQFKANHKYRVTRGTWINNSCTWEQISKTIHLCTSCKSSDGKPVFVIEKDDSAPDYSYLMNNQTSSSKNNNYSLYIFPNPSNGLLNINLKNALDAKYNIEVFDVFGKLIYKNDVLNITGSEFNTEINLTDLNLSNGLYMINVSSDNQMLSQRLIIQK